MGANTAHAAMMAYSLVILISLNWEKRLGEDPRGQVQRDVRERDGRERCEKEAVNHGVGHRTKLHFDELKVGAGGKVRCDICHGMGRVGCSPFLPGFSAESRCLARPWRQ